MKYLNLIGQGSGSGVAFRSQRARLNAISFPGVGPL